MSTAVKSKKYITFSFNSRNRTALQFVKALHSMDFLKIEESPYNEAYVQKVLSMDEATFKPFDRSEIWNS